MNDRSNILHVIDSLDGYGRARMLWRLAAHQAEGGAAVAVAAMYADRDIADEFRERGVRVHVLKRRWPFDPIAALRLKRVRSAASDLQIVHSWDVKSLLHVGCLRRGPRERLVAQLQASDVEDVATQKLLCYVRAGVDAFVVPDNAVRQRLRSLGIDPTKIQIVAPAVATGSPPLHDRLQRLAELDLAADAKVIITAGPLVRRKALDEVMWSFELVRILYPEARLLILGDGPDRGRLERFADGVSEPGCIRLLGYRADIAELLPVADVYWQLDGSRDMSLALREAQAAAVPVIVSDTASHRAAIEPDKSGIVVPLGNRAAVTRATDDLFRDPEHSKTMGAAGGAIAAERWSLERMLADYRQAYAALATAGR